MAILQQKIQQKDRELDREERERARRGKPAVSKKERGSKEPTLEELKAELAALNAAGSAELSEGLARSLKLQDLILNKEIELEASAAKKLADAKKATEAAALSVQPKPVSVPAAPIAPVAPPAEIDLTKFVPAKITDPQYVTTLLAPTNAPRKYYAVLGVSKDQREGNLLVQEPKTSTFVVLSKKDTREAGTTTTAALIKEFGVRPGSGYRPNPKAVTATLADGYLWVARSPDSSGNLTVRSIENPGRGLFTIPMKKARFLEVAVREEVWAKNRQLLFRFCDELPMTATEWETLKFGEKNSREGNEGIPIYVNPEPGDIVATREAKIGTVLVFSKTCPDSAGTISIEGRKIEYSEKETRFYLGLLVDVLVRTGVGPTTQHHLYFLKDSLTKKIQSSPEIIQVLKTLK